MPESIRLTRAKRLGRKFQNFLPTPVGGLSMMLKILPLYLINREERVPKQPPGPFVTDFARYAQEPASGLRVTWMGHSTVLIELDGVRILTDPVWDERASPFRGFGPKRFFAAPLPLGQMPALDVILLSHDHYDHLGEQTVRTLARLPAAARARWVTPLAVGAILRAFGVPAEQITELDWTEASEIRSPRTGGRVTITALPARHFSGRSLRNRWETLWACYAMSGPQHNVFYGADSGYWNGFAEIARQYGPFDLTMLEIGAYNKLWESVHMGPEGAIRVFHEMGGQGLFMPIHWGLFDLALHAWRQPIERVTDLADIYGVKLWSPEPGMPTDVVSKVEVRSPWWQTQPS